jgi:hypothetical protein
MTPVFGSEGAAVIAAFLLAGILYGIAFVLSQSGD